MSTEVPPVLWQSRFRWIVKPGSDLYFVYTHNWVDDPLQNRIYTLDRRAASKVLYTHRLGAIVKCCGSLRDLGGVLLRLSGVLPCRLHAVYEWHGRADQRQ